MSASNYRRRPLEGGYQCEFVEKPKELQSECSICLSILREPYTVDCCGNKFCRTCIKRVEDDNKPCPLCNIDFTSVPDKQLERQLNDRAVYCTSKDKGCNWIGELRQLKKHLNPEASLDNDQELCDYHEIQCLQCQQFVERRKLSIPCPHLPSEPCPYKYAGCTFKKSKPELEAHLKQNVVYHATLGARKAEILDADIKTLRAELQTTKQRSRIVQGELAILFAILLVFVAVNYYQNNAGHLSNRTEHVPVVEDFQRDLLKLEEKIELLSVSFGKDELSEIKRKNVLIEKSIRNLEVEFLTKTTKDLKGTANDFAGVCTENRGAKVGQKVGQKTATNPQVVSKDPAIPPNDSTHPTLPVHLTLASFSEYRVNGMVWYSPPFYTSEGHKLILTVDLNGEDETGHKYTELSLKLLSKGDSIDNLPYEANFTVEFSYNTTVLGQDLIFPKTETVVLSCLKPSHMEYIRDRSNVIIDQLQLTVSAALDNGKTGWITTIYKLPLFLVSNAFMVAGLSVFLQSKHPVDCNGLFAATILIFPPMAADLMILNNGYAHIGYIVFLGHIVVWLVASILGNR